MPKYNVLVGCNFPPDDTRAEPGDVIDVPEKIGEALVSAGAATPQEATGGSGAKKSTKTTTKGGSKAPGAREG